MSLNPRYNPLLLLGFLFLTFGLFAQADEATEDVIIEQNDNFDAISQEESMYRHKHLVTEKWNKEATATYTQKPLKRTNGANDLWEKEKEDMNFVQTEKEVRKDDDYKPSQQDNNAFDGFEWGNTMQNLLIAFGCLLIIGLIIYFVQNGSFRQGKKILVDISDERLDWIEENLPEADVLTPLESAIRAKEYRKAVRLYFLLIVQQLTNAGDINWQKEKTNRAYILETYNQAYHNDFKSSVRIYESVWYGERQVSEEVFNKIEPVFKKLSSQLLSNIKAKNEE